MDNGSKYNTSIVSKWGAIIAITSKMTILMIFKICIAIIWFCLIKGPIVLTITAIISSEMANVSVVESTK